MKKMKIVVVKSPRLLAGFLRFFFKIKKEQAV
ncbi:MAG: stage V sporulation protein SpoVM [Oscillospiraceae bacterium]|nr:stage V sporulation protein SpoVM [Oscillospiraceae bacterium]